MTSDGHTSDRPRLAIEPVVDHHRRRSEYLPAIGVVLAVLHFQSVETTTHIFHPDIAGFDATETIEIASVNPHAAPG